MLLIYYLQLSERRSGAGARNTELSAAKSWITQPYTHIRALKILSRPIQIKIKIIFIQHQLKQGCTTPHNLTKNISKLVLRNLNGLGSYLKPNTKLYMSCLVLSKRRHLTVYSLHQWRVVDLQVKSYIFQILQRFLQLMSDSKIV